MDYYRPPTFSLFPPVVKNLLICNVVFFIATLVLKSTFDYDLDTLFGLHYIKAADFKFYQVFTYMFMHGSFTHILFNMFALWMFGYSLENFWGSERFLLFYLICGIGAAFTQELFQYFYFEHIRTQIELYTQNPNPLIFDSIVSQYFPGLSERVRDRSPDVLWEIYALYINIATVGASGAIFGILLAFGMLFPNTLLYVYFAIPVKAKYFVIFYGLLELFFAVQNPADNVAHYAHLGGMVFGFILIMYWKRNRFRTY
jgi:membrane associated rhomboid family serine protease